MAAPPTFLLFDETGWDRVKFGRNRHPFRQRTELRNKLSPPAMVSEHDVLKTVEFRLFLSVMALLCRFAIHRP
jgi:hypothetical protein